MILPPQPPPVLRSAARSAELACPSPRYCAMRAAVALLRATRRTDRVPDSDPSRPGNVGRWSPLRAQVFDMSHDAEHAAELLRLSAAAVCTVVRAQLHVTAEELRLLCRENIEAAELKCTDEELHRLLSKSLYELGVK